jgi:CRP-like cAMP-binding protein
MSSPHSLRSLSVFGGLSSAESAVFSDILEQRRYRAGDAVIAGESLLAVGEGRLRLEVDASVGRREFAEIGEGGLLGEMDFFEPEPVPILAEAASDVVCLALVRRSLKGSFRYSRTGAVKFLGIFALSLSHKIRAANDLLQSVSARIEDPMADADLPSPLDAVDLQRLQSLSASRSYKDGEVLFREGDAGDELFVIGGGEVEIRKESGSGESITLAHLGPGDFFGEMGFVDRKPRSAAAVSCSPLLVHVLPAGSLERAVELNVGTALHITSVICKIMARRLNVTLRRIRSL